ncbi:MAG TPA: ABC transporter substrate-binding protein [Acidimicrobiales bacterium]|jgi:hypothetical protein|nr:ABC transporter substrate-binding protein [Acidimicrobiales bacterium]
MPTHTFLKNPLARSWRRLRRRPPAMQVRTGVIALAVVIVIVTWLVLAPSGMAGASTPVSAASTSSRGVSTKSITVVFPVISLTSLQGKFGLAEDREFGQQKYAINLFVNQINKAGGIHGRMIHPMIVSYDPTDEANMRSLCKQWTEGSPAVFAVIDGIGSWIGDNQLCITQEGHTPMIAQWTTVTNWTQLGSPYLWWTGADQAPVLQATVSWGLSSGRLGHGKKVGIVVSDQSSDQSALNQYLLPDLKKAGITPQVYTVAANTNETASTSSDATLAVERLKAAGVASVIPMLPENALFPYLAAENSQSYFPHLLLSDYQSSIELGIGLIPTPYEKALDGQEGVTTETLGGFDDARPESQGGYDPGVRSCYATWHKAHPKEIAGTTSHFIEEQGPIAGWCDAIRLFAQAATNAGSHLTRRSFVTAMSKITNFAGSYSPTWSFGPHKMYGPTQYQVVKLHNNVPPSSQCLLKTNHKPQGTCWVVVQKWKPLPT